MLQSKRVKIYGIEVKTRPELGEGAGRASTLAPAMTSALGGTVSPTSTSLLRSKPRGTSLFEQNG